MAAFTAITSLIVAPDHRLAPTDEHISDEWMSTLQPLMQAPGYYAGVWGRCVEQPDKVLMLVVWRNREAWSKFTASEEGRSFAQKLTNAAREAPRTLRIAWFDHRIDNAGIGGIADSAAEMHFIDFPRGSRMSVGDQLQRARGMPDHMAWSLNGADPEIAAKKPSCSRPLCGWVESQDGDDSEEEREGVQDDLAIWIHTWKSPEAEKAFKASQSRPVFGEALDADESFAPRLPIHDAFLKGIERLGGTRVMVEHFQFYEILCLEE